MIQWVVDRFMERKPFIRQRLEAMKHWPEYKQLVQVLVEEVLDDDGDLLEDRPSCRITEINHGQCQGVLIYVIGYGGYQPTGAWYVRVGYGSCSGCDTLEYLYRSDHTTEQILDGLMTLSLHFFQQLKSMEGEVVNE